MNFNPKNHFYYSKKQKAFGENKNVRKPLKYCLCAVKFAIVFIFGNVDLFVLE